MKMKTLLSITIFTIFIISACTPSAIDLPEDSSTSTATSIFSTPSPVHKQDSNGLVLLDFALSPDGSQIAVYTNIGVYIYDLASMKRSTIEEFKTDNYSSILSGAIAFSSDSERIAISSKFIDAPIRILNLTSKKMTSSVWGIPLGYHVTEIEFSPDDKSLLVRNTYPTSFHCEGPEDKVALYDISGEYDKKIYEIDKCIHFPPLKFRFLDDSRLFLYWGTMTPEYSLYLIDSHTGEIISKDDYNATPDSAFLDISPNGQVYALSQVEDTWYKTKIFNIATNETLFKVDGEAVFLSNETSFLTETAQGEWGYWENGKVKCIYQGVQYFPELKISRHGNVFAFSMPYYSTNGKTELQIWNVSDCQKVEVLYFDK